MNVKLSNKKRSHKWLLDALLKCVKVHWYGEVESFNIQLTQEETAQLIAYQKSSKEGNE